MGKLQLSAMKRWIQQTLIVKTVQLPHQQEEGEEAGVEGQLVLLEVGVQEVVEGQEEDEEVEGLLLLKHQVQGEPSNRYLILEMVHRLYHVRICLFIYLFLCPGFLVLSSF